MPRMIETTVYTIDELSDKAKERARCWYRNHGVFDGWYDFVFEDFQTICGLLGIDLDTYPVKLMGGDTRDKPKIWFRGFWSQGDGASFEGLYSYKPGASRGIRAHAPEDKALHDIAETLQSLQKRNFYQLSARIAQSGRYCHEYSMDFTVDRDNDRYQGATVGAEDTIAENMRALARWLYRRLESEYDYIVSDEAIDENCQANDWTFTECGSFFC